MKKLLQFLLIMTLSCSVLAQELQFSAPDSAGFSSDGLDKVTARLQQHIDDGDIPGVVAAIAKDGEMVYFQALGMLNLEQQVPMPENALFRTYSMTRQITSVAALILYEQGKFKLDDPIKMYLPQFAEQKVLEDPSSTDINQSRARVGDITIADLITHTSGLGSRSSALYRQNNVRARDINLDQMTSNAATVPLFSDPGTEFRYGISATILGKLIEVWSDQDFESFLQESLFTPLGMTDTVFWADQNRVLRLATVYRPTNGELVPYQIESVPFTDNPTLKEGGVGLLSTVMDYMRFSQMILNGGNFSGKQILTEETVSLVFENAIPDSVMPIGTRGYWAGSGWTLGGFNVVLDESAYDHPVSQGTIWWDGSAGTRYWIDPNENLVMVIMGQVSPSSGNGFRENFKRLVDTAIIR